MNPQPSGECGSLSSAPAVSLWATEKTHMYYSNEQYHIIINCTIPWLFWLDESYIYSSCINSFPSGDGGTRWKIYSCVFNDACKLGWCSGVHSCFCFSSWFCLICFLCDMNPHMNPLSAGENKWLILDSVRGKCNSVKVLGTEWMSAGIEVIFLE